MASEGRRWGRPSLAQRLIDGAVELHGQGRSIREIARELQISRSAVGRIVAGEKRRI
jgi:orotate phosphoribosyltransferase-like protein